MAILFINLSGAREPPDKTIRYNLATYWTSANTNNITPIFQSASEEPDYIADDDMANEDIITVSWIADQKAEANDINGDSIHHWIHVLRIDIWAQSVSTLLLFCDEINRILWTISPNSATRLVKSTSTNAEGDYFEESEITFERIDPEQNTIDFKPSMTGVLKIHYRKIKE